MGVLDPNRGIDPLIRSHTAAKWAEANWELLDGELGLESDTGRMKYGIGNRWLATPYVPSEGPVQSVNGATGVVTISYLASGQIAPTDTSVTVNASSPGYGLLVSNVTSGAYVLAGDGGSGPVLTVSDGTSQSIYGHGLLVLPSLPTADPGVAGHVWNDGGTLKVSAGA